MDKRKSSYSRKGIANEPHAAHLNSVVFGMDEIQKKILAGLSPEQLSAVTATEGYIRVLAGAGSGKTKTLAARYAYLTAVLGISPDAILCATFTNHAAAEMKGRIRKLIPQSDLGYICTFHSFCISLLHEDCHCVEYPERFTVLDDEDVEQLVKQVFRDLKLRGHELTVKDAVSYISRYKGGHNYVPTLTTHDIDRLTELEQGAKRMEDKVMYRYFREQRKCFGLDFDDVMYFALYLLRNEESVRKKWQSRLEYIMVDEYQDNDKDQFALSELLSGGHHNLFVVGDPDQTIYSWRGADVRFILEFAERHPEAETLFLKANYRSRPPILRAANTLIQSNRNRIEKEMIPAREGGKLPLCFPARSAEEEAHWIADEIQTLLERGVPPRSIAVLYRAHVLSRRIEEALTAQKIPYVLFSGVEFYRRKEIKDALCYLRMAALGDDLSFLRTVNEPRRGMGQKRMEFLRQTAVARNLSLYDTLKETLDAPVFAGTGARQYVQLIEDCRAKADKISLTDLLSLLLNGSGYERELRNGGQQERLDNLAEFKASVLEQEQNAGEEYTLRDFLDRAARFSELDRKSADAVRLMTVHAAKGLEFSYVFLCAFSEGIFPSSRTLTREAMEEERRLAYVAYTRAKEGLYLSASSADSAGSEFRQLSRFVADSGKENLCFVREPAEALPESPLPPVDAGLEKGILFREGQRVRHIILGGGVILACLPEKRAYSVRFDSLGSARTIMASALQAE